MAEQYSCGVNRIFYKSTAFIGGLNVTAVILDKDLNIYCGIVLTEVPGIVGLYYFDYNFQCGEYAITFSENGEKKTSQVYVITNPPEFNGRRFVSGDKLINI